MLVSKFQIHAKSKSKQYYPKPVHNRLSQIFKFYNDSGNHEKQALSRIFHVKKNICLATRYINARNFIVARSLGLRYGNFSFIKNFSLNQQFTSQKYLQQAGTPLFLSRMSRICWCLSRSPSLLSQRSNSIVQCIY